MNQAITFQSDLTNDEITLFCRILNATPQDLPAKLSQIGLASLTEYCKMIKGEKVFTRGKDILEYRLLNLVKYYYNGHVPSEQQISALFQITATESRALIRSITSKYQYELQAIIFETLKEKLGEARVNGVIDYRIALDSTFYKDEFNKILASNPKYALVEKDIKTSGTFIIKGAEYTFLCQHFGLAATTIPY